MPLTGKGVVDMIVTDLAVFKVTPKGLILIEKTPELTVDDIRAKTEAAFEVSPDLIDMQQ
jgi:acyl CoA:acetate/3-ketoacid CoA transferase beta subunit